MVLASSVVCLPPSRVWFTATGARAPEQSKKGLTQYFPWATPLHACYVSIDCVCGSQGKKMGRDSKMKHETSQSSWHDSWQALCHAWVLTHSYKTTRKSNESLLVYRKCVCWFRRVHAARIYAADRPASRKDCQRRWIIMSIWDFPQSLSQGILVGILLVDRLGVELLKTPRPRRRLQEYQAEEASCVRRTVQSLMPGFVQNALKRPCPFLLN